MSLQQLTANYAACNQWANETLIAWLEKSPAEKLRKEVPSSFSSILKTLNHIYAVQEVWHAVIGGPEATGRYIIADPVAEDVLPGLLAQSAALTAHIKALSEAALLEEVSLDTPWAKGRLPRYEFILHCLNHSTYHRGQIITMSHVLGMTGAPITDYNFYNMAVLKRG